MTSAAARQEPFPTVPPPEAIFPKPVGETEPEGPVFSEISQNPSGLAALVDDARRLGGLIGTGIAALATIAGIGTALVKADDKGPKSMKSIAHGQKTQTVAANENPPLGVLIGIGVLLTLAILVTEGGFIYAEGALAVPSLLGNPLAIIGELILISLSLFLINLEVAYLVYVYRVAKAELGEKVRFILTPFDWGLSD